MDNEPKLLELLGTDPRFVPSSVWARILLVQVSPRISGEAKK